jgi:hypothetical protein
MPYTHRKEGNKNCVYKKQGGKKVGCTTGNINDYLAALHMHADEGGNIGEEENQLVGGKADKMTANDIADKYHVSPDKIKDQIRKGTNSEKKEHTNDSSKAREIAMDHLAQYPNYYNNEKEMDKAAAKTSKEASKEKKVDEGIETTKQLIKRLIRENLTSKK